DRETARQKARWLRRSISLFELPRHRFGGDYEPGGRGFGSRQGSDFPTRLAWCGWFGSRETDLARAAPHGFTAAGKMKVKLKFFAILRERVGAGEIGKEIPEETTIAQLWESL